MIETKFSPVLETRFSSFGEAAGTFEGYAATFNEPVDDFLDIIAPGAFSESLAQHRANGTMPALLWSHMTAEPIGKWLSIAEDRHGLAVEGQLTATQRGTEAHALMKHGALALSIGFRINPDGASYQGSIRTLKNLDLVEISTVAIPANRAARILNVKGGGRHLANIRELETLLRDAGLSKVAARRLSMGGWPALSRDDASDELHEIAALLRNAATDFQISR